MLMYCFKLKDQIKNQLSRKKISNKRFKVTSELRMTHLKIFHDLDVFIIVRLRSKWGTVLVLKSNYCNDIPESSLPRIIDLIKH